MSAYIEVWTSSLPEAVPLAADRITVGSNDGNDIAVHSDGTVSGLHAAFERFGTGWCVTDLGSRNGTHVNGERILGPRSLRPADEVRVGGTRLVFRDDAGRTERTTMAAISAPAITDRERDVLLALCRPVVSGELLNEPATVRAIADELVLTEDAVKKHLRRLYEKFHITERPARGRLANEAIRRGAVSLGELRTQADPS